jgi:hypothetical protein
VLLQKIESGFRSDHPAVQARTNSISLFYHHDLYIFSLLLHSDYFIQMSLQNLTHLYARTIYILDSEALSIPTSSFHRSHHVQSRPMASTAVHTPLRKSSTLRQQVISVDFASPRNLTHTVNIPSLSWPTHPPIQKLNWLIAYHFLNLLQRCPDPWKSLLRAKHRGVSTNQP